MTARTRRHYAERATAWIDPRTGAGVTDDGRAFGFPAAAFPRATLTLADVLDAARRHDVVRVYLTGPAPAIDGDVRAWMLDPGASWQHDARGSYLDSRAPVGRYVYAHDEGRRVQIRRAAEWIGERDVTPDAARTAWRALAAVLAGAFDGAPVLDSPSATGSELWLRSIPEGVEIPRVSDDVAELIRSTSGQGRVELRQLDGDTLPALHYFDGRLAYAACLRELGTGATVLDFPARTTYAAVAELLPYVRARFDVEFRAPAGWSHVGLLPEMTGAGQWHYPTRGRSWVDAVEADLAHREGWSLTVRRAVVFDKARPLDGWAGRLVKAREAVAGWSAEHADTGELVARMLRAVLIQTIGALHSRGRDVTRVTDAPMRDRRDGERVERLTDSLWVLRRRAEPTARQLDVMHPELSAQVYGRARARLLRAPGNTGALAVDGADVLAFRTDALYLTRRPAWLDDGKVGRYALKGTLPTPVPNPTHGARSAGAAWDALNALRDRAAHNLKGDTL